MRTIFRGQGERVEALALRWQRMPVEHHLRTVGNVPIIKLFVS
jgi:hypothetical protein